MLVNELGVTGVAGVSVFTVIVRVPVCVNPAASTFIYVTVYGDSDGLGQKDTVLPLVSTLNVEIAAQLIVFPVA